MTINDARLSELSLAIRSKSDDLCRPVLESELHSRFRTSLEMWDLLTAYQQRLNEIQWPKQP